jgi:hypothetical protein
MNIAAAYLYTRDYNFMIIVEQHLVIYYSLKSSVHNMYTYYMFEASRGLKEHLQGVKRTVQSSSVMILGQSRSALPHCSNWFASLLL